MILNLIIKNNRPNKNIFLLTHIFFSRKVKKDEVKFIVSDSGGSIDKKKVQVSFIYIF